jgi:hypothetical protein
MAPKKSDINISAGAGAGKNTKKTTQGNISKPATTKGSTKATSKPAPTMSSFTFKPQSNYPKSGPMQTHLINRRAATPEPPKQSAITRAALRKRLPSDTASSPSAVSASSNSEEAITPAASRIAAFHEARGLTFEELHVHPADDDTATDLPANKFVPQKNSNSAMKAPAKTTKSISHKRTTAPVDATVVKSSSAKTEAPIKKRAADSDSDVSSSPIKRLKINGPRLPSKRDMESGDEEPASAPAKRLKITKITVNPPPATPDVPASSADKSASKFKGAQVITKNGKVKKTPEYAVEHAFEGTPSNHGTSLERPQFGSLDIPWSCANLGCSTGMTWVPRDTKDPKTGKGPMGRKVISQFFGRNKGPTKLIPNDVWHYYCRKDYQRARYAAEHGTADELAKQVIDNLRDQIIRLKLWRPDALFQVQLDKGATDRLNAYFALLRQHNNDEAAALAALPAPKDPKKFKPEEAFPPALAEKFNQRFKTVGKAATANYDDLEAIIAWSEAEINVGNSTVFVPAEFLINPIQTGETVNNVATNFADWEADRAIRTAQASTTSFSVPHTSTTTAQPQDVVQSIEDPDATESEHETSTPTPAPRNSRVSTTSNDPIALLQDLNDEAIRQGYNARSDRSFS